MKCIIITIFSFCFLIGSISAAARRPRMLGGDNARIEDFPYVASLRYVGNYFCAGSIISDRHILTSAHCFEHVQQPEQLAELAGYVTAHTATSSSDESGISHKIQSIHIHPEWKVTINSYTNDIAIVTLKDPIVFDKNQQKINLPSRDVQNDRTANLTGWGVTSNLSWEKSKDLQNLQVNLLTSDKCQPLIPPKIQRQQLCSLSSTGTGPCRDDHGDPLAANGELVGIQSFFNSDECDDGTPVVYSNVFAHKDYIESVIKK